MSLPEKPMSIFTSLPARTGPLRGARASSTAAPRAFGSIPPADSPADPPAIARMMLSAPVNDTPSEAPAIARMVLGPRSASTGLAAAHEAEMLRVLSSQPGAGETLELAFRRIEQWMCALFAQLTPVQARALKLRLEQPREGDALAARFGRLVSDRRQRLLAFLGDARRREAIARAQAKG